MFDQNKTVLQNYSYYPFGMEMNGFDYMASSTLKNNYLYNGKELQDDFGLGWYDYGFRFYDPQLGRWHVLDPKAFQYTSLSPYCYVGNMPTIAIDPNGREIKITGGTKERVQTYNDLAIIYATPMGRQIIDALQKSSTVYRINGDGWFASSSKYRPFWNSATYYQGEAEHKGNKFRSFEMLGHELFHAYQDELGSIDDRSVLDVEKEAVKFENYLRKIYSDGAGTQRLKYGSEELFSILEPTSYNTGGVKRDASTVRTYVQSNYGFGDSTEDGSSSEEGIIKQDNTKVVLDANAFQRIFEYMDNNNLQKVTIDF